MSKDNTTQGTHHIDCWRLHHACALAKIDELRDALFGLLAVTTDISGYSDLEPARVQARQALNR